MGAPVLEPEVKERIRKTLHKAISRERTTITSPSQKQKEREFLDAVAKDE